MTEVVRIVLVVNIAGWEVQLVTEPMPRFMGDVLMVELTRDPTLEIKKARIVDATEDPERA